VKKTWLGILWLGCTALGMGQEFGPGKLPGSTQFYLEYQPKLVLHNGLSLAERLRRSPLFRVFAKAVKLDPAKPEELSTFPYLDGRFLVALARQGELSPFEAVYQAEKKESRLRDLRYAAESAFEGVNVYRKYQKKFPKTIEDLSAHEYFDITNIPEGARLELRRDGRSVSVVGFWDDLEVRWPDPQYKSVGGPSLADFGGLLVGLGCPDSSALRGFLVTWDSQLEELAADGDHWKFTFEGQDVFIYLPKGWVFFTSRPELVEPYLGGPAPTESLAANPRFAAQVGRLRAPDTEFLTFLDVHDIMRTSPGLCQLGGIVADKVLIRSLALSSGTHFDAQGNLEMQARGFLHWDGVQNVTLGPPAAATLGNKIPKEVETVYWLDLPGWVRLVDRLGGEFPGVNEGFTAGWGEMEKRLGFSLPRETLASGTQLYLYGEVIDTWANQLEMLLQVLQSYLGGNSTGLEEALAFSGSKVPLLGVLEMAHADLARQMEGRLKDRLGTGALRKKVENVQYTLSEDGRCAWAASNTTQFWANGYTERQLPRVFSAYQSTLNPAHLAATPSYQQFVQGRQGELLLFLHTKVDREYSLIKGFLLYLGADFRPEAEILGQLRDMYTAIELLPGGIGFRSSLYSAGVAAPPVPPQDGEEE
jgi:hypothetical protein